MKVAVFGATGRLGFLIVQEAIKNNHDVIAPVRNVNKFNNLMLEVDVPLGREVTAEHVDILDYRTFTTHLRGVDVIITCVGAVGAKAHLHCTVISRATEEILKAMQLSGVRRLILISRWGSAYRFENPAVLEWFYKPFMFGLVCSDHRRAEKLLLSLPATADIGYTIIRLPFLTNEDFTEEEVHTREGAMCVLGAQLRMTRASAAKCIFKCLNNEELIGRDIAIGLRKNDVDAEAFIALNQLPIT